jgi:two-component system chemotaxis response regulator CheY
MKTLIVEDDLVTRTVLLRTLSSQGTCDVAVNGEEALEAMHLAITTNDPYQVICLDVMLPDMSGLEVLQAIRAAEERHGIFALDGVKVIMTTSREDSATILSAFKAGCEAYLIKPFPRNDLLAAVEKLLKAAP